MPVEGWQKPDDDASVPSERYHIRVRGVQKTFGPHHVLRGIDLDIERGKINVIIGGSGQGKSVMSPESSIHCAFSMKTPRSTF